MEGESPHRVDFVCSETVIENGQDGAVDGAVQVGGLKYRIVISTRGIVMCVTGYMRSHVAK